MEVGTEESVSEKDVLERVAKKFKTYLEAKKNPIMRQLSLIGGDNNREKRLTRL